MQKAVIYVFSGTGNTRYAADKIACALGVYGYETVIWEARLPFSSAPDPREFDLAGFGYPVHAFNTPQFFLRFVKTLPQADGLPSFLFKTSGEPFHPNRASSWPLTRILRKKGYLPLLDEHLLMPYNIMFRYRDSLAKQMYFHTADMANVIAEQIATGKAQPPDRYYPWTILWMYLFRLQWFGAWINGPLLHAKKDRCTGCGLCAKDCPSHNITMKEGRPHFSHHCTMCMRCVMRCPTDAIRPGFLSLWRINGAYPFEALAKDSSIPSCYIDESTKGYFKLFRKYYRRTNEQIEAFQKRHTPSS